VAAVLAQARAAGLLGPSVVTVGFSMGAATVLRHATGAHGTPPSGAVALAPFADLATAAVTFPAGARLPCMLGRHEAFLEALRGACARVGFALEKASAVSAAPRIACPLLLVHGEADRHLPPAQHATPLARAAPEATVVSVPEAGHVSLVYADRACWFPRLLRFLRAREQETVLSDAAPARPPAGKPA
jgi:alpha-beta hydrolase superfamily lysophospholipase